MTSLIWLAIDAERRRQDELWEQQNHPDSVQHRAVMLSHLTAMRKLNDHNARVGKTNWLAILGEEIAEAVTAETEGERRQELIECAAVVVAWIEAVDRRMA